MEQRIELMRITPEMAAEMLTHNTDNRRPKPHRVSRYANDMASGKWKLNTSIISFDSDGVLINGQHTLMACVRSGVTIDSYVGYGFEHDTYMVIDQGVNRTLADTAKNEAPWLKATTVLALISFIMTGVVCMRNNKAYANHQKLSDAIQYEPICKWAYELRQRSTRARNTGNVFTGHAPTMAAILSAMANGVDINALNCFIAAGQNDVSMSFGYNVKAALDYSAARRKEGGGGGGEPSRMQSYRDACIAIYAYTNNIKKCKRNNNPYQMSVKSLDAINEYLRKAYETEQQ